MGHMSERDQKASGTTSGGEQSAATPSAGSGALQFLVDRLGSAGAQRYVQRRRAQQRAAREEQATPETVHAAAERGTSLSLIHI